jgi:hypothetical protein
MQSNLGKFTTNGVVLETPSKSQEVPHFKIAEMFHESHGFLPQAKFNDIVPHYQGEGSISLLAKHASPDHVKPSHFDPLDNQALGKLHEAMGE